MAEEPNASWIQTKRICSCCNSELLWAKVTGPTPLLTFGKRLYTFLCRRCDLQGGGHFSEKLKRAMRSDTGFDPREDPELI